MPTPNRRLRQARELRGWSQAKVAEQIGTDATTVSRWERGLFSPTPYFREKLCQLFGKNAEELGLLDSGKEQSGEGGVTAMAPAMVGTEVGENGHTLPWGVVPPQAPSWQQRTDTFAYILQSAVHDVQAHLLWEEAYVRVLQGQRAQAQRSGEASLTAFEQVGHMNAAVLREWLRQHGLLTSSSPPPSSSAGAMADPGGPQSHQQPASAVSVPGAGSGASEKPVGAIRRFGYGRSLGFLLVLMMVAAVVLCGLSLGQLQPAVFSSPRLADSGQDARTIATVPASASPVNTATLSTPTATAAPSAKTAQSPQPTSSPTALVQASPTAVAATAALMITVTPDRLTPRDCVLEALGYRCTVTLWPFTGQAGKLSWQASSRDLPVRFNPPGGSCTPGQPFEVITYIVSNPGQQGHLSFTFMVPSSGTTYTQIVLWQD
ncbi:helix-turn-helix domain-containing protein [Thermogemmatispora carboxidivorans]|uniref:helix-turn-helix domain-containing protein n=1 Tax=Thermogemmatispora carboxidivorans TaxID=1382306 RepID=UPI00069AAC93|nr:helix-turn-helix transcriptional regulator [Thermogemmatispora carboxidivorans]